MTFIEFPSFERIRDTYFTEVDFLLLQLHLVKNPKSGVSIKGSSGLRKLRWSTSKSKNGKSGSYRVVYFLCEQTECWLITAYAKNELATLSQGDIAKIRKLIESELWERSK